MSHVDAALNWVHGVITALKPAVSAFFADLGAMIGNRPAPGRGGRDLHGRPGRARAAHP